MLARPIQANHSHYGLLRLIRLDCDIRHTTGHSKRLPADGAALPAALRRVTAPDGSSRNRVSSNVAQVGTRRPGMAYPRVASARKPNGRGIGPYHFFERSL